MFAGSGASVALADLDGILAAKEAQRIVDEGGAAIGMGCNDSDEAQVAAMVDHTVARYGRLDVGFNNAGIQVPPSDAADEPIENFERVTAINQRGVRTCMKHELRVMRAQGSGAINQAHSREFSVDAYKRPAAPKELVWVRGAGHVDLYDRVDLIPWDKLKSFLHLAA
jgi:NAD(P)-dependent dehydrogenase (short-subunit alcohol dehydrogenase family)